MQPLGRKNRATSARLPRMLESRARDPLGDVRPGLDEPSRSAAASAGTPAPSATHRQLLQPSSLEPRLEGTEASCQPNVDARPGMPSHTPSPSASPEPFLEVSRAAPRPTTGRKLLQPLGPPSPHAARPDLDRLFGARPGKPAIDTALRAEPADGHMSGRPAVQAGSSLPMRGVLFGWAAALTVAAGAIFFHYAPTDLRDTMRSAADQGLVTLGFDVSRIAVIGHDRTPVAEIIAAMDLSTPRSLVAFDAADVRSRLAHLPWIDDARVVHILPDMVTLEVRERVPFAIWQLGGRERVIDRNGRTLARLDDPSVRGTLDGLRRVAGRGAGPTARALLDALDQHPAIARRLKGAVRVADRRWNLVLNGGEKILLPEEGMPTALASLTALLATSAITPKTVAHVDLRIPSRPTLRLRPAAATALASRSGGRAS
ncbi:MAG: cell division protein FtsQ/DivIB [Pseudomonadota bacterium]